MGVDFEGHSSLEALVAQVESWDGSLDSAKSLRSRVRNLPDPRRKPNGPAERAIFTARSGYLNRSGVGRPEKLAADLELARRVGPFVGDPDLGPWPFHDAVRISDEDAVAWLPIVGRFAAADEHSRDFVEVMFRTRRRATWMPASLAFAAMAMRDEAMRGRLSAAFRESFPSGLPPKWPQGRLVSGSARAGEKVEDPVHEARHALHAACAYLAAGGDPKDAGGLSAEKLSSMPLPAGDQSDASAVLWALCALAGGESTTLPVLEHLPARAKEAAADEMQEDALRAICDLLASRPEAAEARAVVVQRLTEPRWTKAAGLRRLDALWSWLETAAWLHSHGEEAALSALREGAGEGAPALALRLSGTLPDGHADPVEATLPRIRALLDPDVRATTDPSRLCLLLAELLVLMRDPRVGGAPWVALLRRAMGPGAKPAAEGAAAEAARADLALALASSDEAVAVLLRESRFEPQVVMGLASSQNGFVARQVAVQMERLLRQASAGEPQLRLLWQLLQRDPPGVTFLALKTNLRGRGTRLHSLVAGFGKLDAARAAQSPLEAVAACYAEVAQAAGELYRSSGRDEPSPLEPIARALAEVARLSAGSDAELGETAWRGAAKELLLGGSRGPGLDAWMKWAGLPVDQLEPKWKRLDEALASIAAARPAVSLEQCADLDQAAEELRGCFLGLAWPEAEALEALLARVLRWGEQRREEARRSAKAAEACMRILDRGDEAGALALVGSEELSLLPAAAIRRLGRFLLDHLQFRPAHRLRGRAANRVQLPAAWTHLAPLLGGVAGGTFLVLDVGTAWNDVVGAASPLGLVVTVSLAVALSFALLAGNLASRMAASSQAPIGSGQRALRICARVFPTYLAALLLATFVSAVVLFTLEGTPSRQQASGAALPFWPQVLLWASLSLFLGLFLGLILQGRGVAAEEE